MLLVKTKVKDSGIHGLGLFAAEFIPKDTIIWKLNTKFDLLLKKEDIENFSDAAKAQILHYAYFDENYQKYVLCSDDARFFNHSKTPNCLDKMVGDEDQTIAMRDIEEGEELTSDYSTFSSDLSNHPEIEISQK